MSELAEKKYGKKVCYWIDILWSDPNQYTICFYFIFDRSITDKTYFYFKNKPFDCVFVDFWEKIFFTLEISNTIFGSVRS